jgi:Zn-dependent protease/DNA-directed RNA polymerase subunit RPC12/RpoP
MTQARQGSIHLFRVAGIDLFLHWSWFVVAAFEIQDRKGQYSSVLWNVVEYLALFLIVLLHEFGHALACRQTGGTADTILLWPMGGVAYVNPPQRPGAMLWSLAAGPLVNVALLPFFILAYLLSGSLGWAQTMPDVYVLVRTLLVIDVGLFVFNMLPIYPLDGGQILRSLLWFVMGRARSLLVATLLGLIGVAAFTVFALTRHSLWYGALAVFMLLNCWGGMRNARALLRMARLPRRAEGFACPSCRSAPPLGALWKCARCGQGFDTFATLGACPHCGAQYASTQCLDCGERYAINDWIATPVATKR